MPIYRAFPVDKAGHVCAPSQEFEAETNIEAIAWAMQFVEGHDMEVWDRERRIGLIQRREGREAEK